MPGQAFHRKRRRSDAEEPLAALPEFTNPGVQNYEVDVLDLPSETANAAEKQPHQKRRGGRKPIYATAEERKQRNRQAQAAFRKRRTDHVKQLEQAFEKNEAMILSLQRANSDASNHAAWSRSSLQQANAKHDAAARQAEWLTSRVATLEKALQQRRASNGDMTKALAPHCNGISADYLDSSTNAEWQRTHAPMPADHHSNQHQRHISQHTAPPTPIGPNPEFYMSSFADQDQRPRAQSVILRRDSEHQSCPSLISDSTRSSSLASSSMTSAIPPTDVDHVYHPDTSTEVSRCERKPEFIMPQFSSVKDGSGVSSYKQMAVDPFSSSEVAEYMIQSHVTDLSQPHSDIPTAYDLPGYVHI